MSPTTKILAPLRGDPGRRLVIVLFALAAAVSVIAHVLLNQFFYEPDSISYLSLGDNLLHHHGYRTFEGDWCAAWPPLVPLLLAGGLAFHLPEPFPFALINVVSIAVTIAIAGIWLGRLVDNRKLLAAALVLAIVSPPMLAIANAGYTECLFTSLALGALTAIESWTRSRSWLALLTASILTGLALLTRYIGISVVLTLAIVILAGRDRPSAIKAAALALFLSVSCTPIILWCLLNHRMSGTYTGPRSQPELLFLGNILHVILFALLSFAVGGILVWRSETARRTKQPPPADRPVWLENLLLLLFPAIYVAVLVISASLVDVDPPNNRLLAPAFIPTFIWIVAAIDRGMRAEQSFISQAKKLLIAWFVLDCALLAIQPGPGFLDPKWKESGLISAVSKVNPGAAIYSNDAAACYFIGHRTAFSALDDQPSWSEADINAAMLDLGDGAILAWFDHGLTDEHANPRAVARCPDLVLVKRCNDGALYRVVDRRD